MTIGNMKKKHCVKIYVSRLCKYCAIFSSRKSDSDSDYQTNFKFSIDKVETKILPFNVRFLLFQMMVTSLYSILATR